MITATKIGITGAVLLLGYLALASGDAHADDIGPETTKKAYDAGRAAGCDRGTADARAGKNATDASAVIIDPAGPDFGPYDAQATASGDHDTWWAAFSDGYLDCFLKNTITHDDYVPPVTPPPKKTDPAVIHKDRVQGETSWTNGVRRGAQKGYVQGLTGTTQSTPSGSTMSVPAAYQAGYRCGFPRGLAKGQTANVDKALAYAKGETPSIPDEIPTSSIALIITACETSFPAWWVGYEGTMVSTAGVGYADNFVLRNLAKVHVGGVALVGARRGPRVVRRPGDGHVEDGIVDYADAHGLGGGASNPHWPAPPPGSAADGIVYRSFGRGA